MNKDQSWQIKKYLEGLISVEGLIYSLYRNNRIR
jgi:hypothetical protein